MRLAILVSFLVLLFCLCVFPQTHGDRAGHGDNRSVDPQFGRQRIEDEQRMERERLKERNKERQAKLKRDTDRLLAVATELKEYVDKTNENVLSVDVVRKADEIEKLAHSIKEKMKD
ncbi:MAG: hypothetical protein ACXVZT_01380 [Terriglobales bacterium]